MTPPKSALTLALLAAAFGREKKRTQIVLGMATDLNASTRLSSVDLKVFSLPDDIHIADQHHLRRQGRRPLQAAGNFRTVSASATVYGSTAAGTFDDPGTLQGADGGNATIVAGWQLIQVPFVNFVTNYYYGGGNESVADTTKLAAINFSIQNSAAAAVAFDYCVYDLAFYH